MALANELKVLLVCPRCKGALEDRDQEDSLVCPVCRLSYPIKNGIPVMIAGEPIS